MSDPDNFLSRWSRRKLEADSRPEKSDARRGDQATPPGEQAKPDVPKEDVGRPPAFDVTSLPPIESIGAGTDISAFMQTGVPTALRHAALRRAWTADPAIKDYVGLNENFWDAAGPDGIIPGFGELDPGLDVKRMVAELFGEIAPDKPGAEQHDSANAPAQLEENSKAPDDPAKSASPSSKQGAPQQNENGATQKNTAQEPTMQKMTRRHGGAMPE